MLERILLDVRIAGRGLRRSATFTTSCIATVALGIGAATAVFSVLYGVVFRPLPYPNAEALVQLVQVTPQRGAAAPFRGGLTPEQIQHARAASRTVHRVSFAIPAVAGAAMTGTSAPVRLAGVQVSASLFGMLDVRPFLGRGFTEDEERAMLAPAGERVVVLSYNTWRSHFGGVASVIDTTTTLNGRPHRIIGVMPEGFGFPSVAESDALTSAGTPSDAPEFWMPLGLRPTTANGGMVPTTYALVRADSSREAVTAELNAILPPKLNESTKFPIEVVDVRAEGARKLKGVLWMFQAGVTLILLIACVNVVHLLRARGAQHAHDAWVRLSLGASRYALLRYAVLESLLLTGAGGVVGALIASGLVRTVHLLPAYLLPRVSEVQLDTPVLLFTVALAVATGLTVGAVSALRLGRARPELQARATIRRASPGLLVFEVAMAVLLLVCGGLLINTSINLSQVDLGIETEGALLFRVSVPASRYADLPAREALYDRVVDRLRGLPDVQAVGMSINGVAAETSGIRWPLIVAGQRYDTPTLIRDVSPGFFAALGTPVLLGRDFTVTDRGERPRTVIVNDEFAHAYFGRSSVLGERLTLDDDKELEIVGVVGSVRAADAGAPRSTPPHVSDTPPQVYFPALYLTGPRAMGIIRTSGDPKAIAAHVREAMVSIDSSLVVFDIQTLDDRVERAVVAWRVYAMVSTAFALLAAMLAAVGLYGVLSHSVAVRTREFGVRTAVGAPPRALVGHVMREGLTATVAGVAIGLVMAMGASRFLEALLFGVRPVDAGTYGFVTALFAVVAAIACYLPARRATRIDPVVALRAN